MLLLLLLPKEIIPLAACSAFIKYMLHETDTRRYALLVLHCMEVIINYMSKEGIKNLHYINDANICARKWKGTDYYKPILEFY